MGNYKCRRKPGRRHVGRGSRSRSPRAALSPSGKLRKPGRSFPPEGNESLSGGTSFLQERRPWGAPGSGALEPRSDEGGSTGVDPLPLRESADAHRPTPCGGFARKLEGPDRVADRFRPPNTCHRPESHRGGSSLRDRPGWTVLFCYPERFPTRCRRPRNCRRQRPRKRLWTAPRPE